MDCISVERWANGSVWPLGRELATVTEISQKCAYDWKYQAPMTPAQVARRIPLATPQDHNHIDTVAAMDHPAQLRTCHSHAVPTVGVKYPTSSRRNARVRNGIDTRSESRRISGERANKNGLSFKICVARLRIAEVECSSSGKCTRLRDVTSARTRGTIEKSRRLQEGINSRRGR